jgi:hypothetical protein
VPSSVCYLEGSWSIAVIVVKKADKWLTVIWQKVTVELDIEFLPSRPGWKKRVWLEEI